MRNQQIKKLRNEILDMCFEYNIRENPELASEDAILWAFGKLPSYEEMLKSDKPAEIEAWLPDHIILKLIGLS